ncbi:hypothetical protein [Succinimonas sp.]|uniref:hypothetical protein n=1 Tax=Succinimonas sp. TaxID=1936151 RepID=UPI00386E4FFA
MLMQLVKLLAALAVFAILVCLAVPLESRGAQDIQQTEVLTGKIKCILWTEAGQCSEYVIYRVTGY